MSPKQSKPQSTAKLRAAPELSRLELLAHPDDHKRLREIAKKMRADRGLLALPLIEQARLAIKKGTLPSEFTPAQFKEWVSQEEITKPDGKFYAEASINALLSNSDIANLGSKNLNNKVLKSVKKNGQNHYSFI